MPRQQAITSGCHKYTTANPIGRYLVRNFLRRIGSVLAGICFDSLLDVGCGEGVVLAHMAPHLAGKRVCGTDIDALSVQTARTNAPFAFLQVADVYALPFRDGEFDVVVCCEVLEHLRAPDLALQEIRRVTAGHCLVSVPNEPVWRLLNMARGAFLAQLGNTPGHVNHWNRRSFGAFIGDRFEILETITPLPWIGVLCR
jgi:2-polyprenyl-3-methyl-5-hydroxy-6-metoxy-1,4-benzoquinol methylase